MPLSKSQIDALGQRLRDAEVTEADIQLLDEYRRSFGQTYETIVGRIGDELHLEPTGRPAKSTRSVIEKLRRESMRLTQMQDIAGCRIVVSGFKEQEEAVNSLRSIFPKARLVDRRKNPSHGYRAVHLICRLDDKPIEIQVRTLLQHQWAELSEKVADHLDPAIKYGGGRQDLVQLLSQLSGFISGVEDEEARTSAEHVAADKRDLSGVLERAIAVLDVYLGSER